MELSRGGSGRFFDDGISLWKWVLCTHLSGLQTSSGRKFEDLDMQRSSRHHSCPDLRVWLGCRQRVGAEPEIAHEHSLRRQSSSSGTGHAGRDDPSG